jgi:ribosome biogenesis protein BRX1
MGKAKRKAEKAAEEVLGATRAAKSVKTGDAINSKSVHSKAKTLPHEPIDTGPSTSTWRNREKPLILCARGITYRYRHLMTDIMQLIPHHKSDSKLDTKHDWNVINEIVELKVCSLLFVCLEVSSPIESAANDV